MGFSGAGRARRGRRGHRRRWWPTSRLRCARVRPPIRRGVESLDLVSPADGDSAADAGQEIDSAWIILRRRLPRWPPDGNPGETLHFRCTRPLIYEAGIDNEWDSGGW